LAKIALLVKEGAALLPAVAPLVAALSDKDMEVRDESTEALGNIASRIKD
jgi:HEAT repeat protein